MAPISSMTCRGRFVEILGRDAGRDRRFDARMDQRHDVAGLAHQLDFALVLDRDGHVDHACYRRAVDARRSASTMSAVDLVDRLVAVDRLEQAALPVVVEQRRGLLDSRVSAGAAIASGVSSARWISVAAALVADACRLAAG